MKQWNLLELFKGTGSVSKAFQRDFNIVSLDLDPIYTPTIETDILRWNYKKWFRESRFVPDFVWASPPCNTYSYLNFMTRAHERNSKTAEPYSDRAKEGTKILYKTLEIIHYIQKHINPNVLFVIENPRGMMRHDPRIKQLIRTTTLYCLYGDNRYKPTDFFSNFELKLKEGSRCHNKTLPVVNMSLADRYRIPLPLLRDIKKQFISLYKKQHFK